MLLEAIMQRVHHRDVAPDGRKKEKTLIEREKKTRGGPKASRPADTVLGGSEIEAYPPIRRKA